MPRPAHSATAIPIASAIPLPSIALTSLRMNGPMTGMSA